MEEHLKLTLRDIARLANVSMGTVDRVIHNRGRVSEENVRRIRSIMEEYNYKPNLIARSLAVKKPCSLVALIPAYVSGEYWADIAKGIKNAEEELSNYGVKVSYVTFDQYSKDSFDAAVHALLEGKIQIDGLVISTLFTEEVKRLSRILDEKQVAYVYVDADIEGQNRLSYYGTDSFQGGRLGARMLMDKLAPGDDILVARIRHARNKDSTQGLNRSRGFSSYLNEHRFTGNLYEAELRLSDDGYNTGLLDFLFSAHPYIHGAITFNSSCYILGNYLKESGRDDICTVGYDLIPRNVSLLLDNHVQCLIAQQPELQGYYAVKALSKYILFGEKPQPVNLLPIDVLFKENIQYYHNLSNLLSI